MVADTAARAGGSAEGGSWIWPVGMGCSHTSFAARQGFAGGDRRGGANPQERREGLGSADDRLAAAARGRAFRAVGGGGVPLGPRRRRRLGPRLRSAHRRHPRPRGRRFGSRHRPAVLPRSRPGPGPRSGGLDGRPSRHGSGAGGAASRGATPSTPTRSLPRSRPRIDCCWVNPSARSRAVPTVRRRAPPRRRRSTRMAAQTTVPDRATPREAGGCRVRGCQRTSAH